MGRWADRLATLNASVDGEFGEAWDFLPMIVSPNSKAKPDASRQTILGVLATFTEYAHQVRAHGEGMYKMARTDHGFSTQTPVLAFVESRLPLGWLQREDRVRRVKSGDVYEISDTKPDGEGRLVLELKLVRRAA